MPWPMWPRDMTFIASGMYDRKNTAVLSCIRSVPETPDASFFGAGIPPVADGYVRLDISRGYHYFQMLDDNRTRYVTIFNSDPKLSNIPTWFMNYMMTKICYQMLVMIQEKSKDVSTSEWGNRIRNRAEFYG